MDFEQDADEEDEEFHAGVEDFPEKGAELKILQYAWLIRGVQQKRK
jgi:hypothetical protein